VTRIDSSPHSGIEQIAQGVAQQQVGAEDGEADGETREDHQPGRDPDTIKAT